jgi:hypothetical protein
VIGEVTTLLRLHRIDHTVIPLQKRARAVCFVVESEAIPLLSESCVPLDEVDFVHPEIRCNLGNFAFSHFHLPRPAATSGAALAVVVDVHRPYPALVADPSICNKN